MTPVSSIRDLIGLWSTRAAFAHSVSRVNDALPVSIHQANKWAENGAIPAKFHQSVIDAAAARALPVTAELIVRLHAPRAPNPKENAP